MNSGPTGSLICSHRIRSLSGTAQLATSACRAPDNSKFAGVEPELSHGCYANSQKAVAVPWSAAFARRHSGRGYGHRAGLNEFLLGLGRLALARKGPAAPLL